MVTPEGKFLGKHMGLMYYTLGQRKGLGIGGQKGDDGRWFVVDKDMKTNRLIVAHGAEDMLFSDALETAVVNWIPFSPEKETFTCTAKFRYRQEEQKVTVTRRADGTAYVVFDEKQRAITPGQYCVFYDETKCLGGAVIEKAIHF